MSKIAEIFSDRTRKQHFDESASPLLTQAVKTLSLLEYLGRLKFACRFGVKIETESGDTTNVVVEMLFAMAAYCATLVTSGRPITFPFI